MYIEANPILKFISPQPLDWEYRRIGALLWKMPSPASKGRGALECEASGVSHDGKQLPADVVVRSLDLLEVDAFEKLLEGDRCVATKEVQES